MCDKETELKRLINLYYRSLRPGSGPPPAIGGEQFFILVDEIICLQDEVNCLSAFEQGFYDGLREDDECES